MAPAWGGKGAVTAMSWAGKARDWSLGKVKGVATGKYARELGGKAVEGTFYGKDAQGRRTVARTGTKFLSKTPFARYALRPLTAAAEARKAQVGKYEKDFEGLASHHLKTIRSGRSTDEKIAIDRILAKRGELKKDNILSEKEIAASMRQAVPLALAKEMVLSSPDIAIEYNVINNDAAQTLDQVKKILSEAKTEDITKFSRDALKKMEDYLAGAGRTADFRTIMESVVRNWTGRQVGKMADENQLLNLSTLENYLRSLPNPTTGAPGTNETERIEAVNALNKKLAEWLKASPGGKDVIPLT